MNETLTAFLYLAASICFIMSLRGLSSPETSRGGLLQVGQHDDTITVVSTLAILLASINIFGGFAVTARMLAMYRKKEKKG